MNEEKNRAAAQQIRRVTLYSLWINILLFVFKVIVGWISGSMSLVADGIHSLSDMATDLAVFFGHYFGAKAPDQEHPYGHGRIETFSAALIGLALIAVGSGMIWYAALEVARGTTTRPSTAVFLVACLSVALKETIFRITVKAAKQSHSSALYANAWHHRSDALSSIAVLIGVVALRFGYGLGDEIATMAVGLLIILVGVRVVGECLSELAESAVDQNTLKQITSIIEANPAIRQWHKLRTRSVGREIFLDLHILVDPQLNIKEAHDIAENLEDSVEKSLPCPVNITVHIEPDFPFMRV